MLGYLLIILGQIKIEGFEEAAEQNVLFAVLVSIVIVLFLAVIILFKKLDDNNTAHKSTLEKWKNDSIEKEGEKSEEYKKLTKEHSEKIERINREHSDILERLRREHQDFQKEIIDTFNEIRKDQYAKYDELRKEGLAKEDARNAKWEASEKEILNVLQGVTSVLDLSEKMKENDTKNILERLSNIEKKISK